MNKFLILLSFISIVATTRIANAVEVSSASYVYNALDVQAVDGRDLSNGGSGAIRDAIWIKQVGGLTCSQTTVFPNTVSEYRCTLNQDFSAEDVYKALKVEENDQRAPDASLRYIYVTKSAGGILCSKQTLLKNRTQSQYTCQLN